MRNRLESTAGALIAHEGTRAAFCGTAFALGDAEHYVSAAHVFTAADAHDSEEYGLLTPTLPLPRRVLSIALHDSVDLAVLRVDPAGSSAVEPFAIGAVGEGEPYWGYGYTTSSGEPCHLVGAISAGAVTRVFEADKAQVASLTTLPQKGHSGGPVFRPGASASVWGVVANTAYEGQPIARVGPFSVSRVERAYGVALRLAPYRDWLSEQIPALAEAGTCI